jgi:hypothetical protein
MSETSNLLWGRSAGKIIAVSMIRGTDSDADCALSATTGGSIYPRRPQKIHTINRRKRR